MLFQRSKILSQKRELVIQIRNRSLGLLKLTIKSIDGSSFLSLDIQ